MGIVSATGRSNLGIEAYEDFIQTDAPINPGNSGGALIDDRGELVGINTAILANGSEGNQGIGFAVPVAVAHNVMEQILHNGKVVRAYLGVMSQEVTPAISKAFHENGVSGALVSSVSPDSPASHAGIEKGDIILAVNGQPVADSAQLAMHISLMQPGTDVTVKVLRDGAERTVNARLAELPAETAKLDRPDRETDRALDGVSVENVTARTARQLGGLGRGGDSNRSVERRGRFRPAPRRRDSGSEPQARAQCGRFSECAAQFQRPDPPSGQPPGQFAVPGCVAEWKRGRRFACPFSFRRHPFLTAPSGTYGLNRVFEKTNSHFLKKINPFCRSQNFQIFLSD